MLENGSLTTETLKETMPLLGVPFTTKESNEAKGICTILSCLNILSSIHQ